MPATQVAPFTKLALNTSICGIVERACRRAGIEPFGPHRLRHAVACDLYSPCALGGVLNPTTIPELRCWGVVGSANNQLADDSCARLLAEQGVMYAPDFVVNAGGVINIAEELSPGGYHRERAYAAIRRIYDTTTAVLDTAKQEGITSAEAANGLAERRMAVLGRVQHIRTFS